MAGPPYRRVREDWSDHELSYLLTSRVCFSAWRALNNALYYVVYVGSRSEATENILGDPRVWSLRVG